MHDIRLVAGFEVKPGPLKKRMLGRADSEDLAAALADDLARVAKDAGNGLLVITGGLFEPGELLRPGFPTWQAIKDLARPFHDRMSGGQIMALGTHDERFPDSRLRPPDSAPAGQFLALPLTLILTEGDPRGLAERLEQDLFEHGGIHPPARAVLAKTAGLESVHGQLMTLNDLIALQHVQMDTAGLGPFWPVVEHALVNPQENHSFKLPGSLSARWEAEHCTVHIDFTTFDQFNGDADGYALWMRAFRSLSALLHLHAIKIQFHSELTLDHQRQCLVEPVGPVNLGNCLTEQVHPDCGLLAWTLVEDGRQFNLYPLSSAGFDLLKSDFEQRGLRPRQSSVALTREPLEHRLFPLTDDNAS